MQQIGSRAFVDDLAGFQHVGAVGNGKRHLRVLFHQQNGGSGPFQFPDDIEDLLHQNRSQTHRRLVHHHQLGLAHQSAAHGQHLLFAAGQGARHLLVAFLQPWKVIVHIFNGFFQFGIGTGIAAHLQIFQHCHLQENAPSFRAERHPLGDDLISGHPHDILIVQHDAAAVGLQQSGNGVQRGGFARAIGTDQGHDLPFVHLEGDPLDGVDAAIINVEIIHLQQSVAHTPPSFFLPR